eukprot:8247359-Pyramimonas_sp.AAC.1
MLNEFAMRSIPLGYNWRPKLPLIVLGKRLSRTSKKLGPPYFARHTQEDSDRLQRQARQRELLQRRFALRERLAQLPAVLIAESP